MGVFMLKNKIKQTSALISAAVFSLMCLNGALVTYAENIEIGMGDDENIKPISVYMEETAVDNGLSYYEAAEENAEIPINSVNFPDATFRQYVSENFDTNNSGSLSQSELEFVSEIDVSGTKQNLNNITSLKGIEYFANLTRLDCGYNQLTSLDVSGNAALEF